MQSNPPKGCREGDLPNEKAQAKTRLTRIKKTKLSFI